MGVYLHLLLPWQAILDGGSSPPDDDASLQGPGLTLPSCSFRPRGGNVSPPS